jgi:hypothetical protein
MRVTMSRTVLTFWAAEVCSMGGRCYREPLEGKSFTGPRGEATNDQSQQRMLDFLWRSQELRQGVLSRCAISAPSCWKCLMFHV